MKTIYSLKEFHDQVLELAKSIEENYVQVRVVMDNEKRVIFTCYIHGYSWEDGKTMEECIQKQRDKMFPPAAANIDVEIELPAGAIHGAEPKPQDTGTPPDSTGTVICEPVNTINHEPEG